MVEENHSRQGSEGKSREKDGGKTFVSFNRDTIGAIAKLLLTLALSSCMEERNFPVHTHAKRKSL
jgi:hypothetical protein